MKRNHSRNVMIFLIVALVVVSTSVHTIATYLNRPRYPHELAPKPIPGMKKVPTGTIDKLAEFETHLPIVVLEFETEPGKRAIWKGKLQYADPVPEDQQPFAEGTFRLIFKKDGYEKGGNRLSDEPVIESKIRAALRGLSSMRFPKKQYVIQMLENDGVTRKEVDVLGMGKAWKWILNISHIDKSLLRNYMCLNIASRITGYAPETRYCEVFRKRDDQYEYMGVYLLMEPVERGPSRVPLTKYNPRHAKTAYLLRRDRFQVNGVVLDTYATINKLSRNYLEVKYPSSKKITLDSVQFIEDEISQIEKALYSPDRGEFLEYKNFLDIDSCINYFIINEFFANYDSQWNSYFMHKDINEKLKLGPVWDFDQSIGNSAPHIFNPQSTAMQNGVWFNRLLSDGKFLYQMTTRYHKLRKTTLSDKHLNWFMDSVTEYLGDAIARDWNRWRYDDPHALTYNPDDILHANVFVKRANHQEEINAMKQTLHEHAVYLDENIDTLFGYFVDLDFDE